MKNFIKKKSLFGFILLLLAIGVTNAQMGIGTDEPDASALLDIKASDKGLLIPRMDLGDFSSNPVVNPVESLLVYNTDANGNNKANAGFYYWDGSAWIPISNPAAIGKDGGSTNNSITGFTSGNKAFLSELDLGVNVDGATLEIDATNGIQIKNGGVTKDKILDGAVAPLKIHGDIAGTGLTRSDTGVLSVSIGGATDADGNEIGTGTESDPGAGKDVTSDGFHYCN